jgi:hypothetical protein
MDQGDDSQVSFFIKLLRSALPDLFLQKNMLLVVSIWLKKKRAKSKIERCAMKKTLNLWWRDNGFYKYISFCSKK